jgi:hypothetical protein
MAFTYDTGTDIGKIRLAIGDTSSTAGAGVKPDGTNFTDAELQIFLDAEGTWGRAAAAACETLATWWARAVDVKVGPRSESMSQAGAAYARQAKQLRSQYGGGGRVFIAGVIRSDGYSDDKASDDVTPATDGEYPPDQYWLINRTV